MAQAEQWPELITRVTAASSMEAPCFFNYSFALHMIIGSTSARRLLTEGKRACNGSFILIVINGKSWPKLAEEATFVDFVLVLSNRHAPSDAG